jgi:hypothetical protein
MKIYEQRLKKIQCLKEIQCDFCKKNIIDISETKEGCNFQGGEIVLYFGYGSRFDLLGRFNIIDEKKQLDICDNCAEKIFGKILKSEGINKLRFQKNKNHKGE